MHDYMAESPITINNSKAMIQLVGCLDKNKNLLTKLMVSQISDFQKTDHYE